MQIYVFPKVLVFPVVQGGVALWFVCSTASLELDKGMMPW
jgi:hypothetical protein